MKPYSRRDFLEAALGTSAVSAATLSWSGAAVAEADGTVAVDRPKRPPKLDVEAVPLAGNLWILQSALTNVIALAAPDGALLVDGGLQAHAAAQLKFALRTTRAKRVHTLFNTHWHPESTGLNERLGKAGTKIIAHENTKLWLSRRINVARWPQAYEALPAAARPTETFYDTGQLAFGGEQLEYGHLGQAHTDGDIYVRFRNANVMAIGGVAYRTQWPLLDWETGGWIGGLVGALDRILGLADEDTRIVADLGAPITRAELQAQRTMFFTIYDRLVKSLNKGLGPEEALALEPAKEFEASFGASGPFVLAAFKSLWGHFAPDA
jgi:glyoxylase-like metal-dependent hydrolase (beta-lactamase superfamily II)